MSLTYIRIAKTPEVEKVLADLHARFSLLSESEIVRLALSEVHNKRLAAEMEQEQTLRQAFTRAIAEGGKVGDKILAEKGLERKGMTEQELYDAIFPSHKDNA
jgi:hypothetical protein